MKRGEFITLLGGAAAAWPLGARAQQPRVPVVGFLHPGSAEPNASLLAAFRKGLAEAGYIEGKNVAIEFRWAHGDNSRLGEMAADLVQRQVAVIVTPIGTVTALAAKTATTTIPIVFSAGTDPVKAGIVASLRRPGGNVTGVNYMAAELSAKRLSLLHELTPRAARIALLVNPVQMEVINASTSREIDAAFATLVSKRPDALFVGISPFLLSRRVQLAQLAARHAVPAIYQDREHAEVGGLMSYGASIGDAYRQIGVYTGRILKGAKAADLPVVQSSKFELVINHPTAQMLGLTVSDKLLATADEVIE